MNSVAVYLLASLKNAIELGEKEPPAGERYYNYWARLVAARQTWASRLTHFYGVTGAGEAERRIFGARGHNNSACVPATRDPGGDDLGVFNCVHEPLGVHIKVLHLAHCTGAAWGPEGPCCRCAGAMKHFLQRHHRQLHGHSKTAPQWLVFADDDYVLRVHLLEALLRPHSATPTPLAMSLWGVGDHQVAHTTQGRNGFGLTMWGDKFNCTVPCVHRLPWLGFGGFNVPALKAMANADDLVHVCKSWTVTHDIGLAIYVWMHSFPLIRAVEHEWVMTSSIRSKWEPTIWHNHFTATNSSFSELFARTFGGKVDSASFSLADYVAREEQLGSDYARALVIMKNSGGFQNSVYFREMTVFNSVLAGVMANRTLPPSKVPTDYKPENCRDDYKEYTAFLSSRNAQERENEPLLCLNYAKHMQERHVEVNLGVPDEDLLRSRRE